MRKLVRLLALTTQGDSGLGLGGNLACIRDTIFQVLELAAKECERPGVKISDSDDYWGPEYARRIRALGGNG